MTKCSNAYLHARLIVIRVLTLLESVEDTAQNVQECGSTEGMLPAAHPLEEIINPAGERTSTGLEPRD